MSEINGDQQAAGDKNYWKDGRLVVMRPEARGSDIEKLAAITSPADHIALSAVIHEVTRRVRSRGGLNDITELVGVPATTRNEDLS